MGRTAKILGGALIALLVVAGAAFAFDSTRSDQVAQGVTVSGVDLGGLSRAEAVLTLQQALAPRLEHTVDVTAGGGKFHIAPARAGVRYDYSAAVDQAIRAGRGGWFGARAWRDLSGGRESVEIPVAVQVDSTEIRAFAGRVAAKADRPAVEPHLDFGGDWIKPVHGSSGIRIEKAALASAIAAAFQRSGPKGAVTVAAPVRTIKPKTPFSKVASLYPTVVTVDRSNFKLYLWKDLKLAKTFSVAVGMAGLETPAGLYSVQDKQTNPTWNVPNSAWAGKLAGKSIPPGPGNPIKARWMGLAAGVGIHGTGAVDSLGSAASHGCIRMDPSDVIWLYDRVPVGTPVYIS